MPLFCCCSSTRVESLPAPTKGRKQPKASIIQSRARRQSIPASNPHLAKLIRASSTSQLSVPFTIVYGTQTGTAEAFARTLKDEFVAAGLKVSLVNAFDYDVKQITKEKFLIPVMATYGNGNFPDDAEKWFESLEELKIDLRHNINQPGKENKKPLSDLEYCVFALGNRDYEDFCGAGERLNHLLSELGAKRAMEIGRGDDSEDIEQDFIEWRNKFWRFIQDRFASAMKRAASPKTATNTATPSPSTGGGRSLHSSRFRVEFQPQEASAISDFNEADDRKQGLLSFFSLDSLSQQQRKKFHIVRCVENRELRQQNPNSPRTLNGQGESTRHIEFALKDTVSAVNYKRFIKYPANMQSSSPSIHNTTLTKDGSGPPPSSPSSSASSDSTLSYTTADNFGIQARNPHIETLKLIERLGLDWKQLVKVTEIHGDSTGGKNSSLPSHWLSVYTLFSLYLDFHSKPRLQHLIRLAQFCTAQIDKTEILELTAAKKGEYLNMACTWLDLFVRFPSLECPLDVLLDLMPILQTRFYTISSSSLASPEQCAITVKLTRFPCSSEPNSPLIDGVASKFLQQLRPGDELIAFVRSSGFRMPMNQLLGANFRRLKNEPAQAAIAPKSMPSSPVNRQMVIPDPRSGIMSQSTHSPAPMLKLPISPAARSTGGVPLSPSSRATDPGSLSPLIFVSAGTGIAPFRAFIHELRYFHNKKFDLFPIHFYFGCRNRELDFLYRDEIESAVQDQVITELNVVYSRDPASPFKHIQEAMQARQEELWNQLSQQQGYLYVCGGVNMGKAIREIVFQAAKQKGGMTHFEAEDWVQKLQAKKRYVQELWG